MIRLFTVQDINQIIFVNLGIGISAVAILHSFLY
jgi:hypothetical protein